MKTELDIAQGIRDGSIKSGTKFNNVWLFALRITGTGAAYRVGLKEYVWRDPSFYMNDEFLQRCNGLPVIINHPENGSLNTTEYRDRNIGAVMLPYLREDKEEVWGVSRIYDGDAASLMLNDQLSTSPNCVFKNSDLGIEETLDDGSKLLIEAKPELLDHVAVCWRGVWDKGGPPTGVDNGGASVAEEKTETNKAGESTVVTKPDADGSPDIHGKLDAIMDCLGVMKGRQDSMESKLKEREDKERADAEKMRMDTEAEEKKRADAEALKAKADAEAETKARMDALEEKMKDRPDEDMAEMADAQHKADSVYNAFGEQAPAPMRGEKPAAYRVRLMAKLQRHSANWKGASLATLTPDVLNIAENQIRADALAAAANPTEIAPGVLHMIRKRVGEHTHNVFMGRPSDGFRDFMRPSMRVTLNPQHKAA